MLAILVSNPGRHIVMATTVRYQIHPCLLLTFDYFPSLPDGGDGLLACHQSHGGSAGVQLHHLREGRWVSRSCCSHWQGCVPIRCRGTRPPHHPQGQDQGLSAAGTVRGIMTLTNQTDIFHPRNPFKFMERILKTLSVPLSRLVKVS